MVDSKTGKVTGVYSLSEPSSEREIADLSSRPDFLARLVKLLSLTGCRGDEPFDDARSPERVVMKADAHGHSPVSVKLANASKSTDTLRSSSDSDAPPTVLAFDVGTYDPFERVMPVRVSQSAGILKSRNRRERRSPRRKGHLSKPPLSEPTTTLTTIPEALFERNSLLPQLSFKKSTEQLLTEDALMDTDSSRARAAIALARAQLEHSRPASIHRKRERAANKLMMLPGEYEEYQAMQAVLQADQDTPTSAEFGGAVILSDEEIMRRTVQQSQSVVMALMAAREAIAQRAESKKSTHTQASSISTIELIKECQGSFPEVYRAGDAPLCPPPSMPLPQLPPPTITLPPSSVSPKQTRSRRSRSSPRNSLYDGLPTEYDSNAIQRVDTLIEDLIASRTEHIQSRQRSHSSASSKSRREQIVTTLSYANDDFTRAQHVRTTSGPVAARKPPHQAPAAIRAPWDGAPLTPAPTPPKAATTPSQSVASQYETLSETEDGIFRDVKRSTQSGTPKARNLSVVPNGQYASSYPPPSRPVQPQLLVASDPPKRLAEAEAWHSSAHGGYGPNKPLTRPPGISPSVSSLQRPPVHSLTPQGSPQKPNYANYRYI